jgi:2-polyprenyl-3-methyl-5-hydroxy-6-metoxy-1,4-benzoquinol methylase
MLSQSACFADVTQDGTAVDLGCGTGIVACLMAVMFPRKRVIGVDSNKNRIVWCRRLSAGIPNISFWEGDITQLAFSKGSEVICFDVLHHLPERVQASFIERVAANLEEGGRFILFEVDRSPGQWKYWASVLVDYLLYPFQEKAHFRTIEDLSGLFREAGLDMERIKPLHSPLVAPVLYVGRRLGIESRTQVL